MPDAVLKKDADYVFYELTRTICLREGFVVLLLLPTSGLPGGVAFSPCVRYR